MAIQAQMYPDQLGVPFSGLQDLGGGAGGSSGGFGFDNEFWSNSSPQKYPHHHQQQQLQQQYLLQQLQNQQQMNNQIPAFVNNNFVFSATRNEPTTTTTTATAPIKTNSIHPNSTFSHSMLALMENYRQDRDRCIDLQSQRLKIAVQEQRKRQIATILRIIEQKASVLLKQKDDEIARVTKRASELQQLTRKMEGESQTWKRITQEKEAMVVNLNTTLEQLRERQVMISSNNNANCDGLGGVDDAESCCKGNEKGRGEEEEEVIMSCNGKAAWEEGKSSSSNNNNSNSNSNKRREMGCCRAYNCGETSVMVFLPCRHLCSCKACETLLEACPVCDSPKRASIEALI